VIQPGQACSEAVAEVVAGFTPVCEQNFAGNTAVYAAVQCSDDGMLPALRRTRVPEPYTLHISFNPFLVYKFSSLLSSLRRLLLCVRGRGDQGGGGRR